MSLIKCISLHEPYASAVALGLKPVETRYRRTLYRGTIGIHAAKKWDFDQKAKLLYFTSTFPRFRKLWSACSFGKVVALVDIVDCKPSDRFCGVDDLTLALGDFSPGRWAWMLENVRKLPHPVPAIGRQGFFNVEIDMIAQDGGVF